MYVLMFLKCFSGKDNIFCFMLIIISYVHSILQTEKLGDNYYLLKRNVALADTGKYICVASNEVGKACCSAIVTVIGDSPWPKVCFKACCCIK